MYKEPLKILYIVSYYYLSLPLYYELIDQFPEEENNLLDSRRDIDYTDIYQLEEQVTKRGFGYFLCVNPNKSKSKSFHRIKKLFDVYKYISNIKEKLYKFSPDIIISDSDVYIESQLAHSYANKNNIPFFLIQPSLIDDKKAEQVNVVLNKIKYILINKILRIPIISRQPLWGCEGDDIYLLLWGKYFENIYNKKIKNRTIVTGNIKLDILYKKLKNNENRSRIEYTILYCSQMSSYCSETYLTIKEVAEKNRNMIFTIKVHPREDDSEPRRIFENTGNVIIEKNADILDLLLKSDVFITFNSASTIEALALGIPVISLGFLDRKQSINGPDYYGFTDHFKEISLYAIYNNMADIDKNIQLALTKEYKVHYLNKGTCFLNSFAGYFDGNNAKRAADYIKSVVKKPR